MGMRLTVVDHHKFQRPPIYDYSNVKVIVGSDPDQYYKIVEEHLRRPYQKVLTEQNLDGMISAIIYSLSQDMKGENFQCVQMPCTPEQISEFRAQNIEDILVCNSLKVYDAHFDLFDEVIMINPHESGLENLIASQIMYRAVESPTQFMRDLTGVSIVAEYAVDECYDTLLDIILSHKGLFPELIRHIQQISLNKFNARESFFGELQQIIWAPCILNSEEGIEEIVKYLLNSPPFTYSDILEKANNPAITYLYANWNKFNEILKEERVLFQHNKRIEGSVIFYEPKYQSPNFIREFSNIIKDENIRSIIIMKTPLQDGRYKYSLRRGEMNIDLGKIMEDINAGGGNPYAAGGVVKDDLQFEQDFLEYFKRSGL